MFDVVKKVVHISINITMWQITHQTGNRGAFTILATLVFTLDFSDSNAVFFKCCNDGFIFNNILECTLLKDTIMNTSSKFINGTHEILKQCPNGIFDKQTVDVNDTELACMDILLNGTVVTLSCDKMINNQTYGSCESPFKLLYFWGATMMVFATIIYTLPYILVVIVYCTYSDLRKKAFDKSLICYNSSYTILNLMLITIGFFELCHRPLSNFAYGILGLVIVYFTQSSCLWLFILCFDMTLVITRFRWAPSSSSKAQSEKRKFKVYSLCNWGLSVVPAAIAAITEFTPLLPNNSPIRPNFSNFHGTSNKSLLIHTLTIPVLSLLANTILFIYTTYRMIKVKNDNQILNQNNTKSGKKQYFLYLKLYVIMDSPWLSGALSAIYPSLWILKFVRVIQPIIMLYIILPKKQILQTIGWMKKSVDRKAATRMKDTHDSKNGRNNDLA